MSEVLSPQPVETQIIEVDNFTREQWQALAPLISAGRVSLASELIAKPPTPDTFDPAVQTPDQLKKNHLEYAQGVPRARTVIYTTDKSISALFAQPEAPLPPAPEQKSAFEQRRDSLLQRAEAFRQQLRDNDEFLSGDVKIPLVDKLNLIEKLLRAENINETDFKAAEMNLNMLERELEEALQHPNTSEQLPEQTSAQQEMSDREAQEALAEQFSETIPSAALRALDVMGDEPDDPGSQGVLGRFKRMFYEEKDHTREVEVARLVGFLVGFGLELNHLIVSKADPTLAAQLALLAGSADLTSMLVSTDLKKFAGLIESYPHTNKVLAKLAADKVLSSAAHTVEDIRYRFLSPVLRAFLSAGAIYGAAHVQPLDFGPQHVAHTPGTMGERSMAQTTTTTSAGGKEIGVVSTHLKETAAAHLEATTQAPSLTSPVEVQTMVSQTEVDFVKSLMGNDAWRHLNASMNLLDKLDHAVNPGTDFARLHQNSTVELFNRDFAKKAVQELFRALDSTSPLNPEQTLLKNIAQRGDQPSTQQVQDLVRYLQNLP